MTLDNIIEEIKKAEKIVILTHETPDGDAIGSSLAMRVALKQLGKNPDVIIKEVPKIFDFLPGREEIKENSDIEKYDLAISLDCADFKRLVGNEYFENAKQTIVIDHHGSNKMYGDINFINPVSPACCQILIGMFQYFNINIDKELGTCILTGIITDTGGFRYSGVTPETFEFTADLLQKGVNVSDIYKRVLDTKTKSNFELMKRTIDRMEFLQDGKVTFTYITNKDLEEVNAGIGDHEGLVEIGRDIEGVEVSVFIRQREDDENLYKVSMRSNDYVNVSDVCLMFSGGGHEKAAGAIVQGDIEQVKQKVMNELEKVLCQ
ncbi:MAG: bifunctional oligoribonuclease/PAP phosphatase NrnA [Clostridia bacterium]|jgi:phosphoesterase RecJ-like protein|nr:bifunctional oligoribonuclease/PAP phosphatase NrnA [Clostridia bacterium]